MVIEHQHSCDVVDIHAAFGWNSDCKYVLLFIGVIILETVLNNIITCRYHVVLNMMYWKSDKLSIIFDNLTL